MRAITVAGIACAGLMLTGCSADAPEPASAPQPASTFVVPSSPPVATPAAVSTPTASAPAEPAAEPEPEAVGIVVVAPSLRPGQFINGAVAAKLCEGTEVRADEPAAKRSRQPLDAAARRPTSAIVCEAAGNGLPGAPTRVGVITDDARAAGLATSIAALEQKECGGLVLTSGGGPEYIVVFVAGDGTTTRISVSQLEFRDVGPKAVAPGGCGSITLISDLDAFTQGRGAVPLSVRWQD